jgi:hypothetical protein
MQLLIKLALVAELIQKVTGVENIILRNNILYSNTITLLD